MLRIRFCKRFNPAAPSVVAACQVAAFLKRFSHVRLEILKQESNSASFYSSLLPTLLLQSVKKRCKNFSR
ncbi:hypothetical protein J6590_013627 [Homalodisca vitripennis]|nr:hypothetical protein J6590_013627 [Homalodisca vitripennis]